MTQSKPAKELIELIKQADKLVQEMKGNIDEALSLVKKIKGLGEKHGKE